MDTYLLNNIPKDKIIEMYTFPDKDAVVSLINRRKTFLQKRDLSQEEINIIKHLRRFKLSVDYVAKSPKCIRNSIRNLMESY